MADNPKDKMRTANRRTFLTGAGAGAAATYGVGMVWNQMSKDASRAPWLAEHTSDSFWLRDSGLLSDVITKPLIARSHTTDILVIGGGYTGMSTAWHLRETLPGAKVTIVDATKCGFGASGRNGGWCMAQNLNVPDAAPKFVRPAHALMSEGVQIVRGLSEVNGVDCDFTPASVVDLSTKRNASERFAPTLQACAEIDVHTEELDGAAANDRYKTRILTGAAIYHDGSASVHPGKLARGLRRLVFDTDIEVFEGTTVLKVQSSDGKPIVETDYGTIKADKVVIATNAYTRSFGEFRGNYIPINTNIIATAPLSEGQLDSIGFKRGELLGLYGKDSIYIYAIVTADGRLIFGGGTPVHYYGGSLQSGNNKLQTNLLEDYMTQDLWPQLKGIPIDNRWGGMTAITTDFVCGIGSHPKHANVYYALGYSGEGVSTSFAAGKTLAQLIAGQDTALTRNGLVNRNLGWIPGDPLRSLLFRIMT